VTFQGVSSASKLASIRVAYTNGDATPRAAELRVNGRIATWIAFPPTGDEHTLGTVTIEARLEKPGANNVLTFSSVGGTGPGIAWIEVLAGPREYDSSR
jgi:alpha-galactosidase